MIIKKMKGRGFRGVLSYVLNDKESGQDNRAEIIGGNMQGQTVQELSKEFGRLRLLKPHAKNSVRHFAIRLHPSDKSLSDAQWNKLGNQFCDRFGYNSYRAFVLHRDSEPPHLHIVTCQIGFDGKLNREFKDVYRIKNFCRTSEQALGLKLVGNKHTGNAKLYHVRQRGACKIDQQVRQAKMQSLLQAPARKPQHSVMQPSRQKSTHVLSPAQNFIAAVFTEAKVNSSLFAIVQTEQSLIGQINSLKGMLKKAVGMPHEKQLAAQLADFEKALAQNLAAKIQAFQMEAQQREEHTQQQKRRFKL